MYPHFFNTICVCDYGIDTHSSTDGDATIFNKSWEELEQLGFIAKGAKVPIVLETCIQYLTRHLTEHHAGTKTAVNIHLFGPTAQSSLTQDAIDTAFVEINRRKTLHLAEAIDISHQLLLACRALIEILAHLEYSLLPYDIVIDAANEETITVDYLKRNVIERMTNGYNFDLFRSVFELLHGVAQNPLNNGETAAQRAEELAKFLWNSLLFDRIDGKIVHSTADDRILSAIGSLIENYPTVIDDIESERPYYEYML